MSAINSTFQGGQPARLAAIRTKQVHGMVAQPPVTNLACKFNLGIIAESEDFADMSILKEFDDNGFIDGQYKRL